MRAGTIIAVRPGGGRRHEPMPAPCRVRLLHAQPDGGGGTGQNSPDGYEVTS